MPVCDDGPTVYFNATFSVNPNPEAASFEDFKPRRVSVDAQADAPFATSTGWFAVLFGRKPTNALAATGPEDTGTMVMNRTVSLEFSHCINSNTEFSSNTSVTNQICSTLAGAIREGGP